MISHIEKNQTLYYILSVLISGIFLALSMPLYGYWQLASPALVLLLIITTKQKPLLAYGTGIFATGITGIILSGRIADGPHFANLFAGLGSLSQVIGITLCIVSTAKNISPRIWIPFTASAGVAAEWILSHFLPTSVSISQHANIYALKLASLTGIWGVTFIIWFIAACIAGMILNQKYSVKSMIVMISIITLLVIYTLTAPSTNQEGIIRVAAIQGYDSFTLSQQTAKLKEKFDIAVWSENGMSPDEPDVYDCARQNHIYIAANFSETQPNGKEMNISYLISPDGKVIGKCKKQHLFGKELLEFMRPKEKCPAVSNSNGLKIGLPTCYDTMFTDVIRNYVRDGAKLILVPNSDPEAPNHFFAKMHAGMTAFRAAENAVPVVMADTGSISTIFDKSGKVVAESEHGIPDFTIAEISLKNKTTLYNHIGDFFAYLCLGFVLFVFLKLKNKSLFKNLQHKNA